MDVNDYFDSRAGCGEQAREWEPLRPGRVAGVRVASDADPAIVRLLLAGHPVILVARNSEPSLKGAVTTAQDLHISAEGLAENGIDVTHLLPSKEELVRMLRASEDTVKTKTGKGRGFTTRFLILELDGGDVILMLSLGTAFKPGEDGLFPPMERLRSLVDEHRPAAVFAKRMDRILRDDYGLTALLQDIRSRAESGGDVTFIGLAQTGKWYGPDDGGDLLRLASEGRKAFKESRRQLGKPMRAQTGDGKGNATMTDGWVKCALPGSLPPGLVRLTMADGRGGPGEIRWYIDSPDVLPDPKSVFRGYPAERLPDGTRPDQAANVRFALEALAAGWNRPAIARELVARGYTTDSVRRARGADATCDPDPDSPSAAHSMIRTITKNREMYETGVLTRDLGKDTGGVVTLTGVFPPGGLWATRETFDRVDSELAATAAVYGVRATHTFNNLPVTLDGKPATLVSLRDCRRDEHRTAAAARNEPWAAGAAPDGVAGDTPCRSRYSFCHDDRTPLGRQVHIPHADLAASIARALHAAAASPDNVTPVVHDIPAATSDERRALNKAKAKLNEARVTLGLREDELNDHRNGAYVVSDPDDRRRMRDDNKKTRDEITRLEPQVRSLQAKYDRAVRIAQDARTFVEPETMLAFMGSLADPHDLTYRPLFREALRELTVTTETVNERLHAGRLVTWTGLLAVKTLDGTPGTVAFTGEHLQGTLALLDERAEAVVGDLRRGVVFRGPLNTRGKHAVGRAAELLGVHSRNFVAGSVGEPIILRILMAVAHPPADDHGDALEQILASPEAQAFGNPRALADRIRRLHAQGLYNTRWLAPERAMLTRALARAAEGPLHRGTDTHDFDTLMQAARKNPVPLDPNPWVLEWGKATLPPCPACGQPWRANMRIREVAGLLCLACRTDRHGNHWPADTYDRYLPLPHVWHDAGAPVHADALTQHKPRDTGPAPTPIRLLNAVVAELADDQAEAIAGDYLNGDTTLLIRTRYDIGTTALYRTLAARGVPLRRPETRRKTPRRTA